MTNCNESAGLGRLLAQLSAVLVALALLAGFGVGTAQAAPEAAPPVHLAAAPVSQAIQLDEITTMMEGGFDRDHWWIKISRTELVAIGAGAACAAIVKGPWAAVVCPPLVAALNWAIGNFPVANGFWAEVYTNGRVNLGTW
jgi:hypothetical protein